MAEEQTTQGAQDGKGTGSQGVTGAHPAAGTGTEGGGQESAAPAGGQETGQQSQDGAKPADSGQASKAEGLLATAQEGQGEKPAEGQGDEAKDTPQTGKPEGLPDQFWDPDNGQVRTDSLVKAWKDTRDQLRQAQDRQESKAPEKAEDYKLEPPKEVGRNVENDPGRDVFAQVAHKHGLTQDQAQGVFNDFLSELHEGGHMPEPISLEEEKKHLGKHADAILHENKRFVDKMKEDGLLSEDQHEELVYTLGATGVGNIVISTFREMINGEPRIPTDIAAANQDLPSREELYAMTRTPEYASDPAEQKRVTELFQKVFGNEPAGSSQSGVGVPKGQPFAYPSRNGQNSGASGS